jgi:signal transduction histidine kinase
MSAPDLQQNSDLQRSFELYDQQVTINNIQLGCLIGMVLMPAGVILDHFRYPDAVREFFQLRVLCSILIGLFWLVVRSPAGRNHHRLFGIVLALIPAAFISMMIWWQDGATSPYYAGLNLVLLVVGFILHWTFRESLIATTSVLGMYLFACFEQDADFLRQYSGEFANNIYFLVLTAIIVVAGSGYHFRLRFREYALLYQLDKNRQELEENHRKLKELDEIKSRFFANISHELRTPLTLLLAPLESLIHQGRSTMSSASQELLATMQTNGMRLLKLINDLLDLVRLESGHVQVKHEPLELSPFVRGLVQSVRKVADDKHINLEAVVREDVGWVQADRDKLEKILLNLVFNAVKFTPGGGRVEVNVDRLGEHLRMRVIDTGMGISKENLPNVFSRFWQADSSAQRKFHGAGIGLALVKELVEAQEGNVGVESELNKGTTFTILLPFKASEPAEARPEPVAEKTDHSADQWLATLYRRAEFFPSMTAVQDSVRPGDPVNNRNGPKILIADDEPDMLRFLRSQLVSHFQVIEAIDGVQAFEKAAQFLPDIILLDMMMPGKDGLQVCRELRERTSTKRIPIVLLTARADEETKLQSLAAGASDFLAKPFSTTELHVRVKNLVDSHDYQRQITKQNKVLEATLEQLKETETQLVQTEKLASLGRMSAGIIHEINNPLNFAKTATHMLKRQSPHLPSEDQEEFNETIKDLEEGIDRVRVIVSDLRSFTHPNIDMFEDVSIMQLMTSTLRFLSHEWKDKVEIVQNYAEEATVRGNRHQLIQLMVNLLQNSVDALKTKTFTTDKPRIEIMGVQQQERFLLIVRDNGPGIAPENLGRIYDPFFTTKDVGQGMGLGLSICYRIMQSHGGRITVDSVLGSHCEFKLEFPLKSEKESAH